MKAYYNIYLTIDDVRVWMNKYTSKMSFTFAENLCSTAWKSAVDTASCKLIFNDRNVVELSDIVSKIVEAQQSFPQKEIQFEALNADESKIVFRGYLDLGKLSIESSKIPGSISITAKSPIDKLGKKPKANFVLYPATVKDVVERCVAEAGLGLIVEWKASISGKQLEVPFVVTDEDSDTWRDKIDSLLMEMGGCTLSFDHNGNKFYISKVNDESKAFSGIPVNYHVQSKLKSTTTKFAKDGVVVSYGNLKISKDQIVYYHDINLEDEDSFLKGDEIKPGVYYPFDSDITKTFEEYEESNLDYGTLIGNTRKANNHINLFYVDPASTKVTIIASDMNGKGVSDWYSNETFISKEGGFTYPGGGAFYPRKAWLCFKNNTENSVNITQFSISGDTYYSDAEYRIVMPLDCEAPEEYSAKYIADTETAKTLASFLMNQKRFGSDTSTWTERWENHSLGDKVKIQHKSGNIINAVIVKKESIIYGDELWAKITAVSLDGWSYEQPALVQNNAQSPSLLDPYENAKRNGYTGSREQWESRNDIFYLWSSSETELKPKKRAFWKLGGKLMLFKNLPVGDFGMQDWMKSWAEVMADRTEEYNYLWAKVGLDGEPFLLQGVRGEDAKLFAIKTAESTIIKNLRSDFSQSIYFTIDKSGYKGEDVVFSSVGSINENTIILDLKNDSITITAYSVISTAGKSFDSSKKYFYKDDDGWHIVDANNDNYTQFMVEEAYDSVTLSAIDETGDCVYLGVFETYNDLPSKYRENELLIDGDYAVVEKPNGTEPNITLYEYNTNVGWIESNSGEKKVATLGAVLESAKKYVGQGVNYVDVIYTHKAYMETLTASIINVGKINSGDIESFGYSEDSEGMPNSGYKLEYKGGSNGKGLIKGFGLKIRAAEFEDSVINKNCSVLGTIVNQDENHNIIVKTEQYKNEGHSMLFSRVDGESTPDVFQWSEYYNLLRTRVTERTGDTIYNCNGYINGFSYNGYINRITEAAKPAQETTSGNVSRTLSLGMNLFVSQDDTAGIVSIKIPDNSPDVVINRMEVTTPIYTESYLEGNAVRYKVYFKESYIRVGSKNYIYVPDHTITVNRYIDIVNVQKTYSITNVTLKAGDTIVARFCRSSYDNSNYANGSFLIQYYDTKTGPYLIGSSDGKEYKFDEKVPSTGFSSSIPSFSDDEVNYNFELTASSLWPITKFYSFVWDLAPTNLSIKMTSFIQSASFTYEDISWSKENIGSISFSNGSGITIHVNNGTIYRFDVGGYYKACYINITTYGSELGLYAKNLLPVGTDCNVGASDTDHLWKAVYCQTIYSNNQAAVSKRSLKQDIKEWNKNALEILGDVDVVEFSYKNDPEKTHHIGFIADDTDESIAGENHDRMDVTNCIGVLIKAVQELSEKIKYLEEK